MLMIDKALKGSRLYWEWLIGLGCVTFAGLLCYLHQLDQGLAVTGLSHDVSWGLYIAQFTFFVGVAASAVMVVLPYYLHDVKQFARITILGEFLAVAAVIMCVLFIMVDLGQPARVLNIVRYPSPRSLMFWDMISLSGYLLLNAIVGFTTLRSEREETALPGWVKVLVLISIPWAISIHTVTAFLYSGLAGRSFWLTAILAPRFLASAFAAGPALLMLLCLALRRITGFEVGEEAIQKLAVIMTYAFVINAFFVLMEIFTVFYARIPEHMEHFEFLYIGRDGNWTLAPWMWLSALLAIVALVLLLVPMLRRMLPLACAFVFISLWIEKGLGLIVGGFVPSPLGAFARYAPTLPEIGIVAGIWAIGGLLISVFYKIVLGVRAGRWRCTVIRRVVSLELSECGRGYRSLYPRSAKGVLMSETAVSIEELAEEIYKYVAECAGKKNLKAGDLAKEMIARHGAACNKDDCKKAIRILIDSGRCIYSYLGGSYIQLPQKDGAEQI